ncbi:dTDP-4-dehydrorhamnose reductase [Aquimarina muelleri]|uniref:dTDP-4-dehydrorhamnose reductase n=1 Tax=Aquimarina muelleri TaxID=279356 RepID=A0A918JV75_9FLAO|nr:dTDP-4-dehydrorhamnose reductase [Aquimarina muelleri]MCX2764199.1 dTDP-4-dehydrorhamnose reductase [Aquimarina muelleri]GGX19547.1 NAD(P)-dependent oxidoreductase [Aquimarina muelleri]
MYNESNKIKILVTGSNGQLGQCLQKIEQNYTSLELHFYKSKDLDITNKDAISQVFKDDSFDFVINCAGYTNVEQAEKESEKAFLINEEGVRNLAQTCKKQNSILIHISTDYVFDGKKETPYTEEDIPNPINEYGKSKLAGEQCIQEILETFFIIRTSWLYSEFGHNFFKTILKKSETETELTITTSQKGTPTNANDLATFILDLILINNQKYGIYHFSNSGEATWYDFAKEILSVSGKLDTITLKKTDNYPTFAQRPKYSVLNIIKIKHIFTISPIEWKKTLSQFLNK